MAAAASKAKVKTPVKIDSRIDLTCHEMILGQYASLFEMSLDGTVDSASFNQCMSVLKEARATIEELRVITPVMPGAKPKLVSSTSSPFG